MRDSSVNLTGSSGQATVKCFLQPFILFKYRDFFLSAGHTHADIDQAFSSVAARLRMFDALKMEDLIQELQSVYKHKLRATAEIMDKVANFPGPCDATGCLRKICSTSQYHFFRFSGAKGSEYPRETTPFIPLATTCERTASR